MANYVKEPIDALRKVPVFLVSTSPPADGSGLAGQAGAVTIKVSKDGADWAAYAGSFDETGTGVDGSYTLLFAVADWDTQGLLKFQVSGPSTRLYEGALMLEPNSQEALWYGAATAGAAGSVTLDATAVATASYYAGSGRGCVALVVDGTGKGQIAFGTAYSVGRVLTIVPNWATNPDATSKIRLMPMIGRLSPDEEAAIQSPLATAAALATAQGNITTILSNTGRILGLMHDNSLLDNFVYGSNNLVTSCRQRDFVDASALAAATPGAGNGADSEVRRYAISAVDAGSGQISSFKKSRSL